MSDEAPAKKQDPGAPAWVMTFADLMSLLMCFFVLLLSFSEMDVNKYKQIAGSMREAFGVQKSIKVKGIPRGINVIAREFSPGRPDPTPIKVIEQHTRDVLKDFLDLDRDKGNQKDKRELRQRDPLEEQRAREQGKLMKAAARITAALKEEMERGTVDVETRGDRVVIRIREKASFPSGRAEVKPEFRPILARIGQILQDTDGQIIVAGHTDNVPIHTRRFRSNWELSASRAVSVVHELQRVARIDARRIAIEGRGETQPVAPNDSAENRARNRRVEIVVLQAEPDTPAAGESGPAPDPAPAEVSATDPVAAGSGAGTGAPATAGAAPDPVAEIRRRLESSRKLRFNWENGPQPGG